jgi:hypothetical protein
MLVLSPISQANGYSNQPAESIGKPPDVIQGGEWTDDFWQGQLQQAENIDVQVSHLYLKFAEQLHWVQTWTSHFASGTFWQTEAVSDSVKLAWNEIDQNYFTVGTYTSAVFDAGKSVDWAALDWRYSGIPDGVVMEMRTGNTPVPDATWTNWQRPAIVFMEYYCAYTYNTDETRCFTNMRGFDSSRYIQYQATFSSTDSSKTIAFQDMDLLYGIHLLSGSATSILISPVDLKDWESVRVLSTVPANTAVVIDVLAPDGTVLLADSGDGDSLTGIDSGNYPGLQLRVSLSTADEAVSPDIDLWGLRWSVLNRLYLPGIFK